MTECFEEEIDSLKEQHYPEVKDSKEQPSKQTEPMKELTQKELEDISVSICLFSIVILFSSMIQKAIQASMSDLELSKNKVSKEEAEINRAIALSLEVLWELLED